MAEKLPCRKSDIETKAIGSETLLCTTNGEEIHVLNATAALIWQLCDGLHNPQEMERSIREEFSVAAEMNVLADIENTLQILRSKNLLLNLELSEENMQG